MYYTEIDPRDMKPMYVCKNPHEKAMQRALIQYKRPENYDLVKEALIKAGREDLIGFDENCLIPPRKIKAREFKKDSKTAGNKHQEKASKPNKNNKVKHNSNNNSKNERTKNKRKR